MGLLTEAQIMRKSKIVPQKSALVPIHRKLIDATALCLEAAEKESERSELVEGNLVARTLARVWEFRWSSFDDPIDKPSNDLLLERKIDFSTLTAEDKAKMKHYFEAMEAPEADSDL
jgi:hypothetical protein